MSLCAPRKSLSEMMISQQKKSDLTIKSETIKQSCNYGISFFVLLPTRLINNLFQLMTTTKRNTNYDRKGEWRDKKVFIYILVYFYRFLNASTIIKIRNHLVRFTSHAIKHFFRLRCRSACSLCKAGVANNSVFFFFLLSNHFWAFYVFVINSTANSGTLIKRSQIACSMKSNF